jgi:hypothetical protein
MSVTFADGRELVSALCLKGEAEAGCTRRHCLVHQSAIRRPRLPPPVPPAASVLPSRYEAACG